MNRARRLLLSGCGGRGDVSAGAGLTHRLLMTIPDPDRRLVRLLNPRRFLCERFNVFKRASVLRSFATDMSNGW